MNMKDFERYEAVVIRWMKFSSIGVMGIVVQLIVLTTLTGLFKINYLIGTFLAVETAVLHNFVWHERWTWVDRSQGGTREMLGRLLRFNFTTGALSLGGNLLLMRVFVGYLHLHYLPASLLSIGCCNVANFLVSHHFVFRPTE
jgi:putative flippase GtrA